MATHRSAGWLVAAALALAGCAGAGASPKPPVTKPGQPASASGGACQFLEYGQVERLLGVRFDVAAAGRSEQTQTCVLQSRAASLPDLTLAVTPTSVDTAVFTESVMPKDYEPVLGLGKIAYSVPIAAVDDAGPGVEVGWLSGNGRLITLRYRLTPQAPADVAPLAPKVVELAKRVDAASA